MTKVPYDKEFRNFQFKKKAKKGDLIKVIEVSSLPELKIS